MEGNFYVVDNPVPGPSKGKLARAYVHCTAESELYGKCVEVAHANKILEKNSCVKERLALRKCIDKGIDAQRGAEWVAARDAKVASSATATQKK